MEEKENERDTGMKREDEEDTDKKTDREKKLL